MKVSVIGTGYVGLVSGVCLADKGHEVICVDLDEDKVNQIMNGIPPIFENDLEELLGRNLKIRLVATTDLRKAVFDSELSIIAVGTPFDGERIDLSYVRAVSEQIGEALREKPTYHTVVVKSTVVPGTSDTIVLPILEKASGKKAGVGFGVGMNPEFLREGDAIQDFMTPDRIVIGGIDAKTRAVQEKLYESFSNVDIIRTTNKTAEMIKYTSNSLLATMISFSNEIGNLCAAIGDVDVVDVMRGVHLDKRLSPILPDGQRVVPGLTAYIEAGCGFGGSCFPKDVKALIAHGNKSGYPMRLLKAVVHINEEQPFQLVSLINKHYPNVQGLRVAILGLAFKPGTDDLRESPAIPVIRALLKEGAEIKAYDPVAISAARSLFQPQEVDLHARLDTAINGAQVIVLMTRWDEFADLPRRLTELGQAPLVIDGRRMLGKGSIDRYEGIGFSSMIS